MDCVLFMKNSNFLKEVKLYSLAKKQFCFNEVVSLKQFERLYAVLKQDVLVNLNIVFDLKGERTPIIQGSVETIVKLDCQRCLEIMDFKLNSDINFSFVKEGKETQETEVEILTYKDKVNVFEVIEEALLLDLPMIAKHQQCNIKYAKNDDKESLKEMKAFEKLERKINPFAILSKLENLKEK